MSRTGIEYFNALIMLNTNAFLEALEAGNEASAMAEDVLIAVAAEKEWKLDDDNDGIDKRLKDAVKKIIMKEMAKRSKNSLQDMHDTRQGE